MKHGQYDWTICLMCKEVTFHCKAYDPCLQKEVWFCTEHVWEENENEMR